MGGHGRSLARIAVSGAGWWGQNWHLPHLSRHTDAAIAAIVSMATGQNHSWFAWQPGSPWMTTG